MKNSMISPLKNKIFKLPEPGARGDFGYKRSFYYHMGIDLYCDLNQKIVAIEDGTIVNVEQFTGFDAIPSSPWWLDTWSLLIEGESGVLGYCEIKIKNGLKKGMKVKAGDELGKVIPVLKNDKGNGTTMCHFEQYTHGTTEHTTWLATESQPENLVNPRKLLEKILEGLPNVE
jgi:murein DD-endopeptidase MepM/ murein hydrolase activator NlpD